MTSPAPLIGITTRREMHDGDSVIRVGEAYVQAVLHAGGTPLLLPVGSLPLDDILPHLDGLLFSGGGDIDPALFGGEPHPKVYNIDRDRDILELALARAAVRQKIPFLAICRGIQVVNVALGGTLYTDIGDQLSGALPHPRAQGSPYDFLAHTVQVVPGSTLEELLGGTQVWVNSLHHQGIRSVAPGLRTLAYSPDGLVEAVDVEDHPFGLAVQWHPEWLPDLPSMQALFRALVAASQE
jgi:putative glutamine amidotransferase